MGGTPPLGYEPDGRTLAHAALICDIYRRYLDIGNVRLVADTLEREGIWGPLFTVADLAGGSWPDAARKAATDAVQSAKASERPSLGAQLLADIHACLGDADRITTADLLDKLLVDDEAPWSDLRGRKIDARKLAEMLRPYSIRSSTIRIADG